MADDLSLLFRLKGQYQGGPAIHAAQADIQKLNQSFGSQFPQMQQVATRSLSQVTASLTDVSTRVPVVGTALNGVNKALSTIGSGIEQRSKSLASQVDAIAKASGKSSVEVAKFLTSFVRLESGAQKNDAAFKLFGGSVDLIGNKTAKFLPELEKAGAELTAVTAAGEGAATALAALGGPIGIAAAALIVLTTGAVAAANAIFQLTKNAADFQGKMLDLAQQTGVEIETLSALEVAARTTGGEIGNITQSLVIFQRQLEEAQDPSSKAAESFKKLGIQTSDTETALRQTFAALAAMPVGFAQTAAAADLFGRGAKQVLAILKETQGDLDGTIKKFKELGIIISTDDARAADIFNDELEILNLQLRGLTATASRDLIPAFVEIVKALGELVRAVRPVASAFSNLAGPVVRFTAEQLKALGLVVAALTRDYEALARAAKEADEATQIKPLEVPAPTTVPLPGQPSATRTADQEVANAEAVLAELKRIAATKNQALNEAFERGRIDRAQQAAETIAENKKVLDADKARIDALLTQKEQEIKALDEAQRNRGEIVSRESDAYRAINIAVAKLQQERLDKENEFDVTSKALRARAAQERANSLRSQIDNETNITVKEYDRQIKETEEAIKRNAQEESAGLTLIEQLEQAKIQIRREGLERQKAVGRLSVDEQRNLNNQIQALDQESDLLLDQQRQRRLARDKAAADRARDLKLQELDTTLELQRIAGERLIATQQVFADLRIKSEEDAAREILRIRLSLIDQEEAALKAKLEATKSITSADERVRTEADLNNQLKILAEQRKTIQVEGDRAIEDGRQRDLENERQYADELEDIKERIRDIERDAAQEVIRLMRIHLADRGAVLRAQRDLEIAEEEDRHQRATDSINEQKRELDAEIKILEQHIELLRIGTTEEIEEHNRLIESLERLRIKREELDRKQGAIDAASQTRKRRITDETDIGLEQLDPLSTRSLFGDQFAENLARIREEAALTGESIGTLSANFQAAAQSAAQFFEEQSQAAGNFNTIAGGAIQTFTDGLKQMISAWVLTGETGPAALRKLTAQVLAQVAAQAAVKAIFELAEGFALLFVNPAASAAHFTAAAIYGSIAGVAAIAGRKVAGDLFKSKTGGIGEAQQGSQPGQINPATLARNPGSPPNPFVVQVNVKQDPHSIVEVFAENYSNGGRTRQVVINDGGAD